MNFTQITNYPLFQGTLERIEKGEKVTFSTAAYQEFIEWIEDGEQIDFYELHQTEQVGPGRIRVYL